MRQLSPTHCPYVHTRTHTRTRARGHPPSTRSIIHSNKSQRIWDIHFSQYFLLPLIPPSLFLSFSYSSSFTPFPFLWEKPIRVSGELSVMSLCVCVCVCWRGSVCLCFYSPHAARLSLFLRVFGYFFSPLNSPSRVLPSPEVDDRKFN